MRCRPSSLLCPAILLALGLSYASPHAVSGATIRVEPLPDTGVDAGDPAVVTGRLEDGADRIPAGFVCNSVFADSSTFSMCLDRTAYEFGDVMFVEYRITNEASTEQGYWLPWLCEEHLLVTPADCDLLDDCDVLWDNISGCFPSSTVFYLDPGQTRIYEARFEMHTNDAYRLLPGDYQFWGQLFAYGGEEPVSLVSIPFSLLSYGPQTIQDALSVADAGDTVLVAAGVYHENLLLRASESGVVLRSEDGPAETILDGGGRGSVLYFYGTNNQTAVEGFTIRNGRGGCREPGCEAPPMGGGISVLAGAAPRISGNIIRDNTTADSGGGIGMYTGSGGVKVSGNLFLDNFAGSSGGAVFRQTNTAGPIVEKNTFVGNRTSGVGGAVRAVGSGTVSVRYNVFYANEAGDGGAIQCGSMGEFCNAYWLNAPNDAGGACNLSSPVLADPLLCSPEMERFGLRAGSPCLPENAPCGVLLGAYGLDCNVTSVDADPLPSDPAGPGAIGNSDRNDAFRGSVSAVPNPARGHSVLRYRIGDALWAATNGAGGAPRVADGIGSRAPLRLALYDVSGQRVREWPLTHPEGSVEWEGLTQLGRRAPAGVYWARLSVGNEVAARCTVLRLE